MSKSKFETTLAGKKLTIEIGELAQQANGSVKAQYGDTVVLATVVMSKYPREGIGYFPLSVEFDEKFYAAGRIKGSRWIKREGRPTDDAILTGRLIDRTIRPLFNHRFRNDVQVIVTNLSFDEENDPDILAIIAVSTALAISDIPWEGPVGAVRIGKDENIIIVNPSYSQRNSSPFDIVVSGPKGFINMIEAAAKEVPEDEILKAMEGATKEIESLIVFQNDIKKAVGKKKQTENMPSPNEDVRREVKELLAGRLDDAIEKSDKMELVNDIKKEILDQIAESHPEDKFIRDEADLLFEEEISRTIHQNILEYKKRPDGRGLDEVRKLTTTVGILPRTHGTGLFNRGDTQGLSILTLGAPGLEQSLETMEFVGKKRFMHHYNFPPFSVGETGRMFTGRREIGHGALAERALEPVIPSREKFPYTIRIVTEILSSNGSSSMAAVCGSSLALMDAGVPVSDPVAGIAMGLITEDPKNPEKNYAVLTDIQGPEDHHGDMDLKVAGTKNGITALQMDVKTDGATPKILLDALKQAKVARLKILDVMNATLDKPRSDLSKHAPRIITLTIKPEKIGSVIGPGGKIINKIIEENNVEIDIEDDGHVFITSQGNDGNAEKVLTIIKDLTRDVEIGEIFTGKVVRIVDFGAFVQILPGKDGLVHISELAPWRVEKVEDIVKIDDEIKVRVKNIDREGKISLTMREFKEKTQPNPAK